MTNLRNNSQSQKIENYLFSVGASEAVEIPFERAAAEALLQKLVVDPSDGAELVVNELSRLLALPEEEYSSARAEMPAGLYGGLRKEGDDVVSGWVNVDAIYQGIGTVRSNGGSWYNRAGFARKYSLEIFRSGDRHDTFVHNRQGCRNPLYIRVLGYNKQRIFNQHINRDVYEEVMKTEYCVCCGRRGGLECDHKDGRKEADSEVSLGNQTPADFQPLCKSCNDYKRQICRLCKAEGGTRRVAKGTLYGERIDFTQGNELYESALGCKGCRFYDFVAFREEIFLTRPLKSV